MELPVTLQNKIIDFLKSLPNLDDTKSQRAFIYSAGLDSQLQEQISFGEPPAQFVPILVSSLLKYGKLEDGRYAIEAVLKAAQNYVGQDKRADCDVLIAEASNILELKSGDKAEKPLSSREYLNRQALLNKIRNYWIRGVLERSLFNMIPIDLGLEERLDAIDFVWETPEQMRQPLARGVKAIYKFDELGIGRTLLILGKPGSGKTTTLLEIARELIERAERDVNLPIPVVFNLSSWTHEEWKFADWLNNEFEVGIYKVSKVISTIWIQNQQLLLLLDGIDEVREELRESCVNAINQFSQEYGQTEIIVCSRHKEYELLSQHLRFQGSLSIQPLRSDQIEEYFAQAGEALSGVKLALQTDPVFQELAQTPLMLRIMTLAYQNMPASVLSQMTLEERQHHLWGKYIDRAFERKQADPHYPQSRMLHWLSFLAQKMIQESQTLFLVEQIRPTWLKPGLERRLYPMLVGLMAGLILAWIYGVPLGLIAGALSLQMLAGFFGGLTLGILGSLSSDIKLFTAIRWSWSWKRAGKPAILGVLSGPLIGGVMWVFIKVTLGERSVLIYLFYGVGIGLLIAFISVIFAAVVPSDSTNDPTPNDAPHPNQGIWQTAHLSLLMTLITFIVIILPIAILTEWNLPLSGLLGCISLYAGGMTCLQHMTIRVILWQAGHIPWRYPRFLNDVTNRILLNQTGRSYQFVHDLLRQEIAFKYTQQHDYAGCKPICAKVKIGVIGVTMIVFLFMSVFVPLTINTSKVNVADAQIFTPRLEPGDRVVWDRGIWYRETYHFFQLKRGDIVSFEATEEMKQRGFGYPRDFKEILGLPEEIIEIRGGEVYIDAQLLQNANFEVHPDFQDYGPQKVPPDMYLVVVHNHKYYDEKDKFTINLILKDHIESRVVFRFWPLQKIGVIPW